MNKLTRIFLGSAACLAVAAGSAQAADMMMDAKAPREPVYRCDITGFIELPGTDICFKVGGYARLVVVAGEDQWFGDEFYVPNSIVPDGHTLTDRFQMYGQGRVNFDARTSTEYGTVRAFVELQASDNDTRTGGSANLRHAFVQFGNWTFGKTWSTFLHLDSSATTTDPYVIFGDNFMRRNQIRYTQSFGSGFSFSLAIEDQNYNSPTAVTAAFPAFTPPTPNTVVNDRNDAPDVVANIRVDGDWGNAQLSGALTNNKFREVAPGGVAPAPLVGSQTDSEIGWAALFGLVVNTPSVGEGDYFAFKAIYTDGAHQYFQDSLAGSTNVVWGLCNVASPAQGGCITDLVQTWSLLAQFTHNWSPTFATTLGGSYGQVTLPSTLTAVSASGAVTTTDSDNDFWQAYVDFAWTPVPRTTFAVDVVYGNADYGVSQSLGCVGPTTICGTALDNSDGAFSAAFQVTRSF
jgi:Porin subfamily